MESSLWDWSDVGLISYQVAPKTLPIALCLAITARGLELVDLITRWLQGAAQLLLIAPSGDDGPNTED